MKRAGVKRLRRNLAIAIANGGDATAVAALLAPREGVGWESLDDPLVREQVEWARARVRAGRHAVS